MNEGRKVPRCFCGSPCVDVKTRRKKGTVFDIFAGTVREAGGDASPNLCIAGLAKRGGGRSPAIFPQTQAAKQDGPQVKPLSAAAYCSTMCTAGGREAERLVVRPAEGRCCPLTLRSRSCWMRRISGGKCDCQHIHFKSALRDAVGDGTEGEKGFRSIRPKGTERKIYRRPREERPA